MKVKVIASVIGASFLLMGTPVLADNNAKAADMDCSVLLAQDYSVIPVAVGYIVSAHSITEIDQLDPVEIDDIVEGCQSSLKRRSVTLQRKKLKINALVLFLIFMFKNSWNTKRNEFWCYFYRYQRSFLSLSI